MAISIDFPNKIINVPRADMTLIQSTPTEIRELNLNDFRLTLKDLEDDFQGLVYPKTHNHNTEVNVGGLFLARVIEIINGYTVTFEDGQYAVNLVGANSNVGDVVNVNQVSVRTFNSAGLTSSAAIEYSSFNGAVYIDKINGVNGTVYNKGTPENPVNNVADAKLIAKVRGFKSLHIIGDIVFSGSNDIVDFTVIGDSPSKTRITVEDQAVTTGVEYYDCTLVGVLDGNSIVRNSIIDEIFYVDGIIHQCMISPTTITLSGTNTAHFLDCYSGVPGTGTPTIDMNGAGSSLAMRNYNGGIRITNKNGLDPVSIDLNSGQVKLTSSVTAGLIVVRGVGKVIDDSTGEPLPVGLSDFNGCQVLNETVNSQSIATQVWDTELNNHLKKGTTGKKLKDNLKQNNFIALK